MCGIAFVRRIDDRPAHKMIMKRYRQQKNRGEEGFGYIAVKQSGNVSKVSRFMFEHELKASIEATKYREILLHHRYPTSTPNVPEATHPIKVSHQELEHDYYIVHNGVISNADDIKDEQEKLGYRYNTEILTEYTARNGEKYNGGLVFNDSEALAIELARTIEGKQKKVKSRGAIAYIALQVTKQGAAIAYYYGTNGMNPLKVERQKKFIAICSEGEGVSVPEHKTYRLDARTLEITESELVQLEGERRPVIRSYTTHREISSEWDYSEGKYYRKPRNHRRSERIEAMGEAEIEKRLVAIADELQEARQEGLEALAIGDVEAEDEWKYTIKELEREHNRLEDTLERIVMQTA